MGEQTNYETEEFFNDGGGYDEEDFQAVQVSELVVVKDNTARANLLTISPTLIFGDCDFKEYDCTEERKIYKYVDKKKTDQVESVVYTCNTRNGIMKFKSTNLRCIFPEGFFSQNLEAVQESTRIRVPVGRSVITIYKVEYGVAHLTFSVPNVERI